ncbi:MAG: LysR family transcriptional regulator [Burkholderiales bacterium]|nr:LysR family transcriptional regulator [Burkholderiales bacterium]
MPTQPESTALAELPLHDLAAFEAVARLGTFGAAAAELAVTQSAVSHRVRHLETTLGCALFDRGAKGARPTAAGERYFALVAAALDELRSAQTALDLHEKRLLRVAVAPALGTAWLLPRIEAFRERHPGSTFEVRTVATPDDPATDDCDVLIHYAEAAVPSDRVHALFEDSIRAVCSPAFLAEHGPFDSVDRLLAAPLLRHVLLPWETWIAGAFRRTVTVPHAWMLDDAVSLLEAAAHGLGLALATRVAADPLVDSGRLVIAHPHIANTASYTARVTDTGLAKTLAARFASALATAASG